ncbi:MAG: PilT/PilU family type 4a pilus ATPase [Gammaproteobacteria bacterium]|nr:PilT/PilU family type 4a pilus ATPase [Gammaproteobacteria bacterium]
MNLEPYLRLMAEHKASDLYLSVGATIKIRVEGRLGSIGKTALDATLLTNVLEYHLGEEQRTSFAKHGQVDMALQIEGLGRYRLNVFRQRGQPAMAVRFIPESIPDLDTLGLPGIISDLAQLRRGLILVVGSTGAGKSTTLASLLDWRNAHHAEHILTVEDPIEYTFINKKSVVNQREVGTDVVSYEKALLSALRASPDVVMIGEIRDRATMSSVLELATTGHVVFATLHTGNAYQALERILNLYPVDAHRQIVTDLGEVLRAVIAQRLVPNKEERLVAAVEVMLNTPHIADLIRKGEIGQLHEAMESSREQGMQTFDRALARLYEQGTISLETALTHADSRTNLESILRFG